MKRPLQEDAQPASTAAASDGGTLPGSSFVPSLVEWAILSEAVPPAVSAAMPAKLAPLVGFQDVALLSRRDKTALKTTMQRLVSPIFDAERFWIVLDASPDESTGVYALSEAGRLYGLVESDVLLGFAVARGASLFVVEGVFAFSPKSENFTLVVQDVLLFGPDATAAARRAVAEQFCEYCADKARDLLPFEVMAQRFEPFTGPGLQKLLSTIMWHQETESRVMVAGEKARLNVLGLRLTPVDSHYVPGGINGSVLDWIFPRQFPLFVRLFVLPGSEAIAFGFRDASAGVMPLNPLHVAAVVAKLGESANGSCICKLVFDPTKGLYNVRAVAAHGSRRLTTAAQAYHAASYSIEAITKEELIAWAPAQ